jgi:hypothetical protein
LEELVTDQKPQRFTVNDMTGPAIMFMFGFMMLMVYASTPVQQPAEPTHPRKMAENFCPRIDVAPGVSAIGVATSFAGSHPELGWESEVKPAFVEFSHHFGVGTGLPFPASLIEVCMEDGHITAINKLG